MNEICDSCSYFFKLFFILIGTCFNLCRLNSNPRRDETTCIEKDDKKICFLLLTRRPALLQSYQVALIKFLLDAVYLSHVINERIVKYVITIHVWSKIYILTDFKMSGIFNNVLHTPMIFERELFSKCITDWFKIVFWI